MVFVTGVMVRDLAVVLLADVVVLEIIYGSFSETGCHIFGFHVTMVIMNSFFFVF